MTVNTLFAPAERASAEQLKLDAQVLADAGIVDHLTYVIPTILLVLNKQRQVVYSNRRLLEVLHVDSLDAVFGLRPGELLDCIHAHNPCHGCGTTEFCRHCGAVKAILKSQHEKVGVEAECRITTASGKALEFKVWASPFHRDDAEFTLFSLIDIQDKKRREALEQTFFHDITNLLSSISGHSGLLDIAQDPRETAELITAIQSASREIVAEVAGHRNLMMAENGLLQPNIVAHVSSEQLVREWMALYPNRKIELDRHSQHFTLTTDRSLLFRVVLNMLKNAMDAAGSDGTITISCKKESTSGVFSVHNPEFMPRKTQLQVFQRSFTTKGRGRGIGTYSMRLFGEKYLKGNVGFTTSAQNGTTFYIVVPLKYPE